MLKWWICTSWSLKNWFHIKSERKNDKISTLCFASLRFALIKPIITLIVGIQHTIQGRTISELRKVLVFWSEVDVLAARWRFDGDMSIIGAKFKLKNLPLLTVLWVFGKNYVKSTQSAKSNHTESCFHENSLNFLLRLSPYTVRCGKTRNSLSSEKYFVKSTL